MLFNSAIWKSRFLKSQYISIKRIFWIQKIYIYKYTNANLSRYNDYHVSVKNWILKKNSNIGTQGVFAFQIQETKLITN